jgi:hypothetical protein
VGPGGEPRVQLLNYPEGVGAGGERRAYPHKFPPRVWASVVT